MSVQFAWITSEGAVVETVCGTPASGKVLGPDHTLCYRSLSYDPIFLKTDQSNWEGDKSQVHC